MSASPPKMRRSEMPPEMAEAERRRDRLTFYQRQLGRGGFVDAGPTQKRLRHLHLAKGVSIATIGRRTGVDLSVIRWHIRGYTMDGPLTQCLWSTEQAVLGARFTSDDADYAPGVGVVRRLQALMAIGFPLPFLEAQTGRDRRSINAAMLRPPGRVYAAFAEAVIKTYDTYSDANPADFGVTSRATSYALTVARKRQWAVPHCWDEDTIDDPGALPEWTGVCGTEYGVTVHKREGIPLCEPCRAAAPTRIASGNVPVDTFARHKFRATYTALGFTPHSLADAVGCSADSIYRWQGGQRNPRKPVLNKIADVLGVPPEELYSDDVHHQ